MHRKHYPWWALLVLASSMVLVVGGILAPFSGSFFTSAFAAGESVGAATQVVGLLQAIGTDGLERKYQDNEVLPLFEGDLVLTQEESKAHLVFTEGIEVILNELTEITILSRWEKIKGQTLILRITQGEFWVQMQEATIPLEVETPVAIAAMGGSDPLTLEKFTTDPYGPFAESPQEVLAKQRTEFTLRVDPDGSTMVTVIDGGVEFGSPFNSWLLPSSTFSMAERGGPCTKPQPIENPGVPPWTKVFSQ